MKLFSTTMGWFKSIFAGVMVTLAGAYLWLFWFALLNCDRPHKILTAIIIAGFGLSFSAIFLVPLGALIGFIMPQFVLQGGLARRLAWAATVGVLVAGGTSFGVMIAFKTSLPQVLSTMIPVCVAPLVVWVLLSERSRSDNEAGPMD